MKETKQKMPYDALTDEQVVALAQEGDRKAQEYLIVKHKGLVKNKARAYFLMGADKEDIIQEGMIGLYKAVRDFQAEKNVSFRSFAELCINRQMITAIKTAGRQKHIPLNSSLSLNRPVFEEQEEQTYLDLLESTSETSPEALFIGQEEKVWMEEKIASVLSRFEHQVLSLYLEGKSYAQIAHVTQKSEKSIDNALQRVKKKIENFVGRGRIES